MLCETCKGRGGEWFKTREPTRLMGYWTGDTVNGSWKNFLPCKDCRGSGVVSEDQATPGD